MNICFDYAFWGFLKSVLCRLTLLHLSARRLINETSISHCTNPRLRPRWRHRWWAQMDSNHRPRAYQARALTTWAMSPFSSFASLSLWSRLVIYSYDWWRWWDSNPWPPACRAGALPTELHPHRCVSRSSLLVFLSGWSLKIEQQSIKLKSL